MPTITIRLNAEELSLLDDLTRFANMPSRSHTLRAILSCKITLPPLKPKARAIIDAAAEKRRSRSIR